MSSPLPLWLRPVARPLSNLYGWAVARRNARFDRGQREVAKFDHPVISIGNITTGGTGKTPMVAWIARFLMEQRLEPVIAMRGYKAQAGAMSDEEAEYRDLLPNTPVLAQPDRTRALREFLPSHPTVKCVLLDDGFQHRQIHRDLDLVLVDASAATLSEGLLPAGHLREPLVNLARADGVIVTRASIATDSEISDLRSQIERYHGKPPLAVANHRWDGLLQVHNKNVPNSQPIDWLRGKKVLTLLGIGNPAAMIRQLESQGAEIGVNMPCRDHERIDWAKLSAARKMCDGLDAMVVTGKDWVKLREMAAIRDWPVPIVVPQLMIEFVEGEADLRRMIVAAATGAAGVMGGLGGTVRRGDAR